MEETSASSKRRLTKEEIRVLRKRDEEMVTGIFRNVENPGQKLEFSFRKWGGVGDIKKYEFHDGCLHTVPRCVAEHINVGCRTPVHEHTTNERGEPLPIIGRWKPRYSFHSADYGNEKWLA